MFGERERDLLSVTDEHILFLSSCFYLWRRSMWGAPSLSCTFLSCLANSCWVLWSCTWRLQMSCGCGCGAICWWEKLKYTSMQINLGFSVGVFYARKKKAARTQEWQSCRLLCQAWAIDWDFQVMSTTSTLTSRFWDPSFTLGDCRMDMTDCQD